MVGGPHRERKGLKALIVIAVGYDRGGASAPLFRDRRGTAPLHPGGPRPRHRAAIGLAGDPRARRGARDAALSPDEGQHRAHRRGRSAPPLGAALVMFRDGYDLRAATLAACRRAGFEPSFALEGAEMDGVLRLTAAGLGVAVVPSLVIDPGGALRAVRLAEPITRTIGFANRRDRRLSRAGREFVDAVRGLLRGREWLRSRPPGLQVLAD